MLKEYIEAFYNILCKARTVVAIILLFIIMYNLLR